MPNTRASTRLTLPSRIGMTLSARQTPEWRPPWIGRCRAAPSPLRCRFGKITAVLRDQYFRAGLQVARARVITQARPKMQHLIQRRRGQRCTSRKTRHEALVVRDHRRHLRLLQHHLRDPHPIGRRIDLPRQRVPAVNVRTTQAGAARTVDSPDSFCEQSLQAILLQHVLQLLFQLVLGEPFDVRPDRGIRIGAGDSSAGYRYFWPVRSSTLAISLKSMALVARLALPCPVDFECLRGDGQIRGSSATPLVICEDSLKA